MRECMFCATHPIIEYEAGATSIRCLCKQTAMPDYKMSEIVYLWDTEWHDKGVISYQD